MVALNIEDLTWDLSDGTATLTIRRSKTDQEGRGRNAFLPVFAVRAVRHWLRAANISTGPIFRRVMPDLRIGAAAMVEREVPRIFKRIMIRIGIPSAEVAKIAGHSTRIGGAHDLISGGYDLAAIMQAGGWTSPAMPARYTRELRVKNNAMAQLLTRGAHSHRTRHPLAG
jgi:integrase